MIYLYAQHKHWIHKYGNNLVPQYRQILYHQLTFCKFTLTALSFQPFLLQLHVVFVLILYVPFPGESILHLQHRHSSESVEEGQVVFAGQGFIILHYARLSASQAIMDMLNIMSYRMLVYISDWIN